jgi:GNAT superfamily N-acetyltransferase
VTSRVAVRVRAAERSELPEILELLSHLHEEPPPVGPPHSLLAVFEAILADPNRTLLIALQDETVVGTLDVTVIASVGRGGRPWGTLENFIVAAPKRGRGIGSALLGTAVEICRGANCYEIQLVSHSRHVGAARFYERSGFDAPVRGLRRYLD